MEEDMQVRVPPHDTEAEKSVLGAMMLYKDSIGDVTGILDANDYYHAKHGLIHDIILDLFSRGEPADAVMVADALNKQGDLQRIGGVAYLHELTSELLTWTNVVSHARVVRERSQLRRLIAAGTRVTQLGYGTEGGDVEARINAAQSEIFAVSQTKSSSDYRALGEFLAPARAELERIHEGQGRAQGVPTGLVDLDKMTHGLQGGQMVIIAARPAMGKSTLAVDICRSASIKHDITSAFFSLEMSAAELTIRIIAAESAIDMTKMRDGELTEKQWRKINQTLERLEDRKLFIDDSPNVTIAEIRSKCRRLKQQENLGLVVVDYLQLMTSGRRVESRQQEVSEFSRSLKLLAKELDLPVIAVAQLNRGPEARTDHRPMLSDLRESGSLEQDADMVFLLSRPEVYQAGEREGEADLIVAKNRNGRTGTVAIAFQGNMARFVDFARE